MTTYPKTIRPMLAQLVDVIADSPEWQYEVKWDGVRTIAYIEDGKVTLHSRTLRDVTHQFPELAGLGEQLGGRSGVLDGEIVSFGGDGRPSFNQLQNRLNLGPGSRLASKLERYPINFQVFDLLYLGATPHLDAPLAERRQLLETVLAPGDYAQVTDAVRTHGTAYLEAITRLGLEGMIAKRLDSPYIPGKRSRYWLKVKVNRHGYFVVCGWTPGEGQRATSFGALILGLYDDGQLTWVGNAGGGFKDASLAELAPALQRLETSTPPFTPPVHVPGGSRWTRPELVCRVRYAELTGQRRLRFPVFEALVPDVAPRDCTFAALA